MILVAEDDEALRRLIARILRNAGYAVLEAANGEDALNCAGTHGPVDLLVIDVVMPKIWRHRAGAAAVRVRYAHTRDVHVGLRRVDRQNPMRREAGCVVDEQTVHDERFSQRSVKGVRREARIRMRARSREMIRGFIVHAVASCVQGCGLDGAR